MVPGSDVVTTVNLPRFVKIDGSKAIDFSLLNFLAAEVERGRSRPPCRYWRQPAVRSRMKEHDPDCAFLRIYWVSRAPVGVVWVFSASDCRYGSGSFAAVSYSRSPFPSSSGSRAMLAAMRRTSST
jgi:hypothetical protein